MSKPDDDTGVPSGFNDDAEMERTSPRVPNRRGRNRVESDDESEGEGAGGVKRRCQEGAAEARGSLGGGGKRGWLA